MRKWPFEKTSAGREVELYTLANSNKVDTNHGGIVVSLKIPGRGGNKLTLVVPESIVACRFCLRGGRKPLLGVVAPRTHRV